MKTQDILAQCLADIQSGRATLDDCLENYPDLADQLRPLLEISLAIRPVGQPATAQFREKAHHHLVETMRLDEARAGVRSAGRHRAVLRVATGLAATVVLGALGAAGTVYAAQPSLPGDALYPVKTAAEQVQLAFRLTHEQKAFYHLKLAERRLDEVAALAERRPEADAAAPAQSAAEELDLSVEEMGQSVPVAARPFAQRLSYSSFRQQVALDELVPAASPSTRDTLHNTIAVLRRSKLIADVSYDNSAFLASRPSVLDDTLEADRFEGAGTLTTVDDHTGRVDGLTLDGVAYPGKSPAAKSRVRITGLARGRRTFVTSIAEEATPQTETSVAGVFQGASDDGAVWKVGGIAVPISGAKDAPPMGDDLQIRGVSQDGIVNVSLVEASPRANKGIEIQGTLMHVDQKSGTITLVQAGIRVKVYTSEASILTGDNDNLSLADLEHHEGNEVRASGVYREDGSLYARQVSVTYQRDRDRD